ncbi:MAG TPA: aldo/keto reductase [Acidobacteriota bacterium]|nr:aldo/keto reductase [Acidobacteriota bacterium]
MTKLMNEYRTLGKTGLKVSPLALGVMTFGWGTEEDTARDIFNRYHEVGGNFFDTADLYTNGVSEEWLGKFIKDSGIRDFAVVATKFSFNAELGNPNAGGNGRKNILRAIEGSLKRLQTDYIDLYIMHTWDRVTPVEEVISTLNDLVRQGKVRHIGLSDVPAYYASRTQTIAELRGYERIATLQMEYSLVSRSLEREHLPLAQDLGISITPWSPLASGFLSGKYRKVDGKITGQGRVFDMKDSGNPTMEKFAKREKNWEILEVLVSVAKELNRTPAEVALRWVMQRPQVTSVLIGATSVEQLEKNLNAITFEIPQALKDSLDRVSQPEPNELDHFFGDVLQNMVHGGVKVTKHL